MFFRKQFRGIALITLFVFICFTFTFEYSFGQDESPLIKAQDLYYKGNFIEAIKVLETFIKNIQNNQTENKRLAEAYYLLARINYDSGEDAKTEDFLKQALEAYDQIGKRETDRDFKTRLDQVKKEWLKTKVVENKIVPEATSETKKVEGTQPKVQEKEKPIQQLKKKKKLPWLLIALGVGAIAALIVLLIKKKNSKSTLDVNFTLQGYFFAYPSIGHLSNVSFKIYVDGTFVKESSTTTLANVDIPFTKSLEQGIHKLTITIVSSSTKLSPVLNFWLESLPSESQLIVTPPLIIIGEGKGFGEYVDVNDSIEVTFEVKPLI